MFFLVVVFVCCLKKKKEGAFSLCAFNNNALFLSSRWENSLESLIILINCFSITLQKVSDILELWLVGAISCITALIFPFRFQSPPPPNNTGPSYPPSSLHSQPASPHTASTSCTTQLANQLNSMQINSYGNQFYPFDSSHLKLLRLW